MTPTPTSGADDMPEALRRSTAADGKTELFNLPGYPLMVRAVDFNRIHAESEMRRAALLDEMQKAALAAGQGFRDGVASVAANAREPVYQARYQKGFWQDSSRERYEYLQNPENTCAEDWETRILYTHPPTAQAEGWRPIETAPKGELVLLWSEIKRGEPFIGDWAEYARYNHPQFTHWSRWDGLPPTSAEGVEHG